MGSCNQALGYPERFVKKAAYGGEERQQRCTGKFVLEVGTACKNTAFGLCQPGFAACKSSSLRLPTSDELLEELESTLAAAAFGGAPGELAACGTPSSRCCSPPRSCGALVYNPVKRVEKRVFYQQSPGGAGQGINFICASIHRRETNNRLP